MCGLLAKIKLSRQTFHITSIFSNVPIQNRVYQNREASKWGRGISIVSCPYTHI